MDPNAMMISHPNNSSLSSKDLPPPSRHILLLGLQTGDGMMLDMNRPISPYSTISPSSLISTMPLTTGGGDLGSYDNLLLSRSNLGEVQLTASSTQIDYNEFEKFDMDDEELITTRHLNRVYQSGNVITGGLRSSSSSSYKDESLTTSQHSISTSNFFKMHVYCPI